VSRARKNRYAKLLELKARKEPFSTSRPKVGMVPLSLKVRPSDTIRAYRLLVTEEELEWLEKCQQEARYAIWAYSQKGPPPPKDCNYTLANCPQDLAYIYWARGAKN
jgi:hypothetical protein